MAVPEGLKVSQFHVFINLSMGSSTIINAILRQRVLVKDGHEPAHG